MEGAGNDFIVLDNREYGFSLDELIDFTPKLCNRRFGIGADGLLVLEKSNLEGSDYKMIYRNADGSDAGMCGNGGRCMALFASSKGFGKNHTFNVHRNIYKAEVVSNEVQLHFPVQVSAAEIEIDGELAVQANAATEHIVIFKNQEELRNEPKLIEEGRRIRKHKQLNPPGTNVNFVCSENDRLLSVQTYERGVENLTLACGTGALASAIATHHRKKSEVNSAKFEVQTKGGLLTAAFQFDPKTRIYHHLILTGPAHFVFEGTISV